MEAGYRNLWLFLLLLPLLIAAGFWFPYFSEFPNFDSTITVAVHVHAWLLFAWVALLVIQPLAIRRGAYAMHRLAGRASYLLMPLIVLFAAMMIRKEYLEHLASGMGSIDAVKSEYLSALQLLFLVCFYVLAIIAILQRDIATHLRYMICIAFVLLPAGLARTLGYWFDVRQSNAQAICLIAIDLCLTGLIVLDWRRRQQAEPYRRALLAYLAAGAAWLALGRPV
jgi:hypothetical protein